FTRRRGDAEIATPSRHPRERGGLIRSPVITGLPRPRDRREKNKPSASPRLRVNPFGTGDRPVSVPLCLCESPLRYLLILLARAWQLGPSRVLPPTCRYQPSCSEYAIEALQKHGAIKGGWIAAKRLMRCHPWGGHGYDPVP